ncbi:hypothetical protein CGMCC3_g8017 [Colletotrichum fructicola]|nr:uncharacterized protein CGMCC3_g8017 [Colletotrichum fructicola]KAE9575815.1 hypothetical protein CGMCC3_g8017 [Colletotrichum fructicola]
MNLPEWGYDGYDGILGRGRGRITSWLSWKLSGGRHVIKREYHK